MLAPEHRLRRQPLGGLFLTKASKLPTATPAKSNSGDDQTRARTSSGQQGSSILTEVQTSVVMSPISRGDPSTLLNFFKSWSPALVGGVVVPSR